MADCKRFPPGHPQRPPHTFSMAEAAYMQARLTLTLALALTLTLTLALALTLALTLALALQPAARVLAERGGSSVAVVAWRWPPCRGHPADAQAGRAPVARRVRRERRGQDGGEQAVHELPGAQQP